MAVRLSNPPIDNTEKLLETVLKVILMEQERVIFLVDPGTGEAVVQRLRVMISRKRKDLLRKGKRVKRFKMRDAVYPETHAGRRFDACVIWQDSSERHRMQEDLERMLANG